MKSVLTYFLIPIVLIVLAYTIVFTRFGTHLVIDVIPEIGSEKESLKPASDGPFNLTAQLSPISKIPLPESLDQPSGIKHRNGYVYISTDQTEIFKLNSSYEALSDPFYLDDGPMLFKQGTLEGLEVVDGTLYAVGAYGSVQVWRESDGGEWERQADIQIPENLASIGEELSGIVRTPYGDFAVSEEHQNVLNLSEGSVKTLDFGRFLKDEVKLKELAFGGIAYTDNSLFIVTENYTSIIVADAQSLAVTHIFGIEAVDAADISIHAGRAYIVIDHNYNEPKKPIHVYNVAEAIARK